ncbi:hypothetical protein BD410DRAFT_805878 [Rickenella mellea]|uniref:Uncharacterized protein n=1 Tax=Rickenella mellea TaxID=50990 RepID=A0A4Y7PVW4_9AGAM|nr:hypothetical protein BD410DRAFT_805878 [Rickenella mellea]
MDDLDALLKLLTRVKTKGWTNAFLDPSGDEEPQKEWEPLLTLLQEMGRARACLKATDVIREHLRRKLRALRRVNMPLVLEDGAKRLPDEVLAIIFEKGFIMDGSQFSLNVSHVSRRFRRISIQMPLLWTRFEQTYSEGQIREFISRSGQLYVDVDVDGLSNVTASQTESFLQLLGENSHRWSSFYIPESGIESAMTRFGITNLPRLRHLAHTCQVNLSTWSMPALTHVEAWSWLLPAGNPLLSQLTHFELNIYEDSVDIQELAVVLHDMKKLQDLSLDLNYCKLAEDVNLPLDTAAYPKPHSIPIEKLTIHIYGAEMEYSAILFDALMHLTPSTLELSSSDEGPAEFFRNSKRQIFPYGSTIKLTTSKPINVLETLADLDKSCDIVRTVHFDASSKDAMFGTRMPKFGVKVWRRLRSLSHLRFKNFDSLNEQVFEEFTKGLLLTKEESGLQSLEILSCKNMSEDFLLDLRDEVGDRLKWTL